LNIIIILFSGMVYFLFLSLFRRQKNPNELISYLVLALVLNLFFVYRLGQDISSKVYINSLVYASEVLALVLVVLLVITIFCTIGSLRESMYEDIFWEVGANRQAVEIHKRKTLYKASLKISLFLNFLFMNTLLFLCIAKWNPDSISTDLLNWTTLLVYSLLLVSN